MAQAANSHMEILGRMNKQLRHRIKARLEEETRNTATLALQDDGNEQIAAGLRNIETYTQLLKAMKPNPVREWMLALIVAMACLMIAGLLWYLRLPEIHVSLKVRSNAVTFELQKPWRPSHSYTVDKLRIERLTTVLSPALEIKIENESDEAWLEVEGDKVVLQKLNFGQNGLLELNPNRGLLEVFYRGSRLNGEIAVSGASSVSAAKDPNRAQYFNINENFKIPESIRFHTDNSSMVPTLIKIYPRGEWTFQDIYVQKLSFFQERITEPGSVFFVSSINSGSISIHDVSLDETLHEGDRLILEGVEGRLRKVGHGSQIELVFDGTVETLLLGPKGFEKNLSPSYLEYLYVRKPLAFFWGAVVFLWGLLWRVRKMITY